MTEEQHLRIAALCQAREIEELRAPITTILATAEMIYLFLAGDRARPTAH